MRPAWRAADRAQHLWETARGWREDGLLDDAALAALAGEYGASGPRLETPWRILVFICVAAGSHAAFLLGLFVFGAREPGSAAAVMLPAGAVLALLTDLILDRAAFRQTGAEAATSLLAVSYMAAGAFALCEHLGIRGAPGLRIAFAWSAAVLGLAAWRWGFRIYAAAAAGAGLLLAAQFPGARLLWIMVAAFLALGTGALLARRNLAPSHRESVALVRVVALGAIYLAINYLSLEKGLLEEIGPAAHHRPGMVALWLAAGASALYPIVLLLRGVRGRDRALLDLGIIAAGLSLATFRFYVNFAPLWSVLALTGAAVAGTSLLLERWLRAGQDGERTGFTAASLSGVGRGLLPVATAIALAPEGSHPAEGPPGIQGDGRFGGGGAGGTY